jgi:uncharacterized membrane protein YjjP (DUF1212 family)
MEAGSWIAARLRHTVSGAAGAAQEQRSDGALVEELVLRFARAAHHAGFPSDDLEHRVEELAVAVGREAAVSATPTLIEVVLGSFPQQRTSAIRVSPQPVDLELVGRLEDFVDRVRLGLLTPAQALAELAAVQPVHRPWPIVVGAYALSGAAVTPVLGGGWRESLAAAIVGLAVGTVAIAGQRREYTRAIGAPFAAIVASLGCALLAEAGVEIAVEVATLGALVALLPGMALTIGMRELATNHLQSGVANSAVAFVQLVGLVFGVAVGSSIAAAWFGLSPSVVPDGFGLEVKVAAAVLAGVAFTVTLNGQRRDMVWACGATVLAIAADEAMSPLIGDEAAVFVAALAVGLAGNVFALARRRSALIVIVPGILMLVPGSVGYESAARLLLTEDTIEGVTAAVDTLVTALSIVYGLIVSAALLPALRSIATERR